MGHYPSCCKCPDVTPPNLDGGSSVAVSRGRSSRASWHLLSSSCVLRTQRDRVTQGPQSHLPALCPPPWSEPDFPGSQRSPSRCVLPCRGRPGREREPSQSGSRLPQTHGYFQGPTPDKVSSLSLRFRGPKLRIMTPPHHGAAMPVQSMDPGATLLRAHPQASPLSG